ncbi:ABC-2 type transport system ATP-binding protein [Fontibacillus phaseoli]|uniref:ABC-2 type transport system ATP-binding protein n=1 Tax=Fontibacillus phaseoli TaxID=1416533 RepID=A0A369B2H6_9BACL|nr:ABC transporter ATP-binding protein [Fontibacillus phaseoli]RCX13904.1 ABC-2 type transport system ATP-binding protein [Fontibacillus phaseoli]
MSRLSVTQLSKKFGTRTAVKEISFELEEGGCTALLGPNGAGKTTTLRMLAGLLSPTSGSVLINGKETSEISWRNQIGYLPQHPSFYGWMTGKEYVVYAAGLSGMTGKQAVAEAELILERVGLSEASRRRISGYSGGMKQRLGLAQALVHHPRLLLLDEPVSALDPLGRREVMDLLQQLRQGTTILLSTHVLHDAEEVCDRIIMLRSGEIVEHGSLAELSAKYRQPLLTIQVESDPKGQAAAWLHSLQDRSFVRDFELRGDTALLTVSDMGIAREVILKEAGSRTMPLLRFEAGATSLEDMFMKVVGS